SLISKETICREAYVTCRDLTNDQGHLRRACLAYNSRFAACFFALTSGSFPFFIKKMAVRELLQLPLPIDLPDLSTVHSFEAIDEIAREVYGFTAADWALIQDFLEYTLPDALRKAPGPGRNPTQRRDKNGLREPEMTEYSKVFARVVKGTFGKEKAVSS